MKLWVGLGNPEPGMLRQRHVFHALQIWMRMHCLAQGPVTRSARSIFRALSWCMLGVDLALHQGHLPLVAQLLAMLCKLVSSLLQAMVNVNSPHLPRPFLDTSQKQGGGIGTATERNGDRQGRLKTERQQTSAACRIIC